MIYQGAGIYTFNLDGRDVELSSSDVEKIVYEYNEYQSMQLNSNITNSNKNISLFKLQKVRKYNTNKKILTLFKKHYNDSKTKKEVFEIIAKDLKISFKAVEKAYYKK